MLPHLYHIQLIYYKSITNTQPSMCVCVLALLCFRGVNLARVILIKSQNVREIERRKKERRSCHCRNWIESSTFNVKRDKRLYILRNYINLNIWNSFDTGFSISFFFDTMESTQSTLFFTHTLTLCSCSSLVFRALIAQNFQHNYTPPSIISCVTQNLLREYFPIK